MLSIHQANSSRKWRWMIKNAKIWSIFEHLCSIVVEDFKFWVMAGLAHRIPENEIVKCFVNRLNPEIFKEEMFSMSCDTLVEVMAATRADLATNRDILEISEQIKKPEVKKDFKERSLIMMHRWQIKKKSMKTFNCSRLFPSSYPNKFGKEKDLKELNAIKGALRQ